jgi:hypothetical protein
VLRTLTSNGSSGSTARARKCASSLDTQLAGEGKGVKSSSLTGLDDPFRRVLSALGWVLVAVGPVARESAAIGGDKGIYEVLQLSDAR